MGLTGGVATSHGNRKRPTMTPTDPTVRALVAAINADSRQDFAALLAPDATMSDDGTDRDPHQWIDREIFGVNGHMEVLSESDGGRTVQDGRVQRFETGQA